MRNRIHEFDALPDSALIGMSTILALTGKSESTIYRHIKAGKFPAPVKLGQHTWTAGTMRRFLNGGVA